MQVRIGTRGIAAGSGIPVMSSSCTSTADGFTGSDLLFQDKSMAFPLPHSHGSAMDFDYQPWAIRSEPSMAAICASAPVKPGPRRQASI